MAIWTSCPSWGTIPVVRLYELTDKGEVVDLFTDRVEAEFAMLDVAADESDLAEVSRDLASGRLHLVEGG